MKENDIVKAILKYLKTVPHCFAWKEHGGMYGTAGIPDIIACIDGGFYAFEVKTEIINSGGYACVVRSVDEVKAILHNA